MTFDLIAGRPDPGGNEWRTCGCRVCRRIIRGEKPLSPWTLRWLKELVKRFWEGL